MNNGVFTPIDGQQRLTTLFLLHWYIAAQLELGEKEFKTINVTYKTRVSARDFCAALIVHPIKISDSSEISKQIEDASWFFLAWKKDPTVKSMLVMLDAIQKKLKNKTENLNSFWEKLTDIKDPFPSENTQFKELVECIKSKGSDEIKGKLEEVSTPSAISFKFLNMGEFELNDELYLKMNARGRALSDWENFKAWLIGKAKNIEFKVENKNWQQLLDQDWTDWLWKKKELNDQKSFDLAAIQLVKNIAFIAYFLNGNTGDDDVYKNFLSKNDDTLFIAERYEQCFGNGMYDLIIETFKVLMSNKIPEKIWDEDYSKSFLNDSSFKSRTYLYAFVQYYSSEKKVYVVDYFRVVRNLVENSKIDKDNYQNVLKAINLLATDLENIRSQEIKGFDGTQLEEERLKLSLINEDGKWRKEIIKAERHLFFKGQIRFLLHEKLEDNKICEFKKWYERAVEIFPNDEINQIAEKYTKTALLIRALISQFEKWGELWDTITFDCEPSNWKSILNQSEKYRKYVQIVLSNDDKGLEALISNTKSKMNDSDKDCNKSIHEHLYKTQILDGVCRFCLIRWNNNSLLLFPKGTSKQNIRYHLNFDLFAKIFQAKKDGIIILKNENQQLQNKNGDKLPFYWGENITVIKENESFIIDKDGNVKEENSEDVPISIDQFLETVK